MIKGYVKLSTFLIFCIHCIWIWMSIVHIVKNHAETFLVDEGREDPSATKSGHLNCASLAGQ